MGLTSHPAMRPESMAVRSDWMQAWTRPSPVAGLPPNVRRTYPSGVGGYGNGSIFKPSSLMQKRWVGLTYTHAPSSRLRFSRRTVWRAAMLRQAALASPSTPSTSRFGTGIR